MPGFAEGHLPKLKPVKIWPVSKLAFMALGDADKLKEKDREILEFLYCKSPAIKHTVTLALKFKELFRSKSEGSLSLWLQEALMPVSELKWFAKGILADYEAVNQAVNISNGPVEGQVNKLKTIKRNMYGRAGFGLLKRMMLANST